MNIHYIVIVRSRVPSRRFLISMVISCLPGNWKNK